jgi:hypothetical protein
MKPVKKQNKVASKRGKSGRKQAPKMPNTGSGSDYREAAPTVRFDATIHAPHKADPNWVDQLNIDRVPGPKGLVGALVTAADCVRLLDLGFEVRLHHAHPVRPLNPALIETDESAQRWLDKELKKIKRPTEGKPKRKGS